MTGVQTCALPISREYQAVFSHPQIQAITQDASLVKKFQSKDGMSQLSDPRIQNLLKNEDLMKKVSALAKLIYENETKAAASK